MALPALLGGAGLSLAAHELLLLTGDIFGVSGFVHRSFNLKGNTDALAGVAGLVVGGVVVATLEGPNSISPLDTSPAWILLSGFLVGLGTKLANGCTSGHMICGISRLSFRSIAATATFFATASLATNIFYGDMMTGPISPSSSWLLSWKRPDILLLQAISLLAVSAIYAIPRLDLPALSIHRLRLLAYFITAVQFGLALRLSDLTESRRVLGFLLPFRKGFDPSLLFVASSSIPLGIIFYKIVYEVGKGTNEKGKEARGPRLGVRWSWNNAKSDIDPKLIIGSAVFGFGWGMTGICPGTGVVNIGRALGHGQILSPYTIWTVALAAGGFVAENLV